MDAATQLATSSYPAVDPFQLVFHIDIFLLALAGVFALAKPVMRSVQFPPSGAPAADNLTSDESHTLHSEAHLIRHPAAKKEGWSLPPHVRAWSSRVPTFANILRYRLDVGFSLGQALVLVIYSAALVYPGFFKSNPFADPLRTGFVAMSQIPVVYLLATKNNLLGMFLGLGYEKLNYIHRFAGILLVIASNVHSLGYICLWTINHTFAKNIREPAHIWAFVALTTVDLIYLFSIPFFRRRAYNVFYCSHVVFFIFFLPALHAHQPGVWPYVVAAAGIISFDYLLRFMKTRVFNARIRPIPDLMLTRIEVPQLNAGWRAGQHVRIPLTHLLLLPAAKTPEGMVLMCKNVGGWTGRLYEMAKVGGVRTVQVMIEGPYGGPGHCVFASYSAAMFIVGGSGITFALSAVQDILQRDSEGASRVKIIEVIWSVQDFASLNPLVPQLAALIQQSIYAPLRVSVYYTRASDKSPGKDFLPPGLTLTAGRPKVAKILDAVMSRAVSYGSNVKASMDITGVVVGFAQVISQVDDGRRWAVGGIEMHEEVFEW
ncbi:ferric reductase like transmembrane component-domain-containing protein [Suillus lakei]|nr:ferric reductase like transmembrane component-domain-containing protein [Suillus lakei]